MCTRRTTPDADPRPPTLWRKAKAKLWPPGPSDGPAALLQLMPAPLSPEATPRNFPPTFWHAAWTTFMSGGPPDWSIR